MPKVQRKVATQKARPEAGAVQEAPAPAGVRRAGRRGSSSSAAPPRGTRAEALEKIFETAEKQGEGFRTGALGLPRHGKTFHLQEVVEQAIARGICEWSFIHDTKKLEPQYQGSIRENVAELTVRPLEPEESPIVVFHPSLTTVHRPEVEDVAFLALNTFGRSGQSCLLVVDELAKALKGPQSWASPTTGEIIREGSSQNVSIALTGQDPQSFPREAIAMLETYALFRLAGRLATYTAKAFELPEQAEQTLNQLQVGEFLLVTLEGCDGRIYGPG
jgi:hypothetical protein